MPANCKHLEPSREQGLKRRRKLGLMPYETGRALLRRKLNEIGLADTEFELNDFGITANGAELGIDSGMIAPPWDKLRSVFDPSDKKFTVTQREGQAVSTITYRHAEPTEGLHLVREMTAEHFAAILKVELDRQVTGS